MIKKELQGQVVGELGFEPTNDQAVAIEMISEFVVKYDPHVLQQPVFMIRGYAGTGKTSLIGALVKAFLKNKQRFVLLAPTGRAAKVFGFYAGVQATTIHKKIYRQKSGKEFNSAFALDRNLHKNAIFIVDEASMIGDRSQGDNLFGTGDLLSDLINYVYSGENCRLILVGDVAQLPPVGLILSPALRENVLLGFGKHPIVTTLRQVIRQTRESGILYNATQIRTRLASKDYSIPKLTTESFNDVQRLSGNDFVETLQSEYQEFGSEQVVVVTRSNKLSNTYNMGIRNQVLWYEGSMSPNDRLMVVKNNYFWASKSKSTDFIANGDIVIVKSISSYEERYGFQFADVTIELEDYSNSELDVKIILDTITSEAPSLSNQQNTELFYAVEEDYMHIAAKRKRFEAIREDPYFNALQVKFAYAFTCHKSQGGQWHTVFVDPGYFTDDMVGVDYLRWLYTAFTRASRKLYLVNFNPVFFEK